MLTGFIPCKLQIEIVADEREVLAAQRGISARSLCHLVYSLSVHRKFRGKIHRAFYDFLLRQGFVKRFDAELPQSVIDPVLWDCARIVRTNSPRALSAEDAHGDRLYIKDSVLRRERKFQVGHGKILGLDLSAGELRREGKVLDQVRTFSLR